jgi:signal transduction histidine kinase
MLTETLNDFLSVEKIEEGKIQIRLSEFDIEQFIKDVIEEMINTLKANQKISYSHAGPTIVNLDKSLLKHIVHNLVSNASKFSSESSEIIISTQLIDNKLLLNIRDFGIGISIDDQKHLMEPFFRGSNVINIQGTGLGLHIVSKYVELMNGVLEYESKIEEGTIFKISFNLLNI